ncbi:MAG: SDR family oxidoreductase [Thiobacillaceae bacterium]
MQLSNQRIAITGAGGGIGKALTAELAAKGARLCLLVRQGGQSMSSLTPDAAKNAQIVTWACDVSRADQREAAVKALERSWGGVDVLINLAGVLDFRSFQEQDPAMLQRMVQVNIEAPMQWARALLPGMLDRGHGRIVNVGSMFGSIGFPFFAVYSATKFALRGYSQALRRELVGTGVGVTYVSPRAVNTRLNPPVVHEMASRGMMHMDEPGPVAKSIVKAIEQERSECYLGFPESLFARINAVLPGLVDFVLAKQTPSLLAYAIGKNNSKAI